MNTKNNLVAKAGVIGCGQIGSWLDEKSANLKYPKTHAGMYNALSCFNLIALCDNDTHRRKEAQKFWNCPYSTSDLTKFLSQTLDVVSICTPPENREAIIRKVIAANVKVILCEKPVAVDLKKMQKIAKLVQQASIQMPINYVRRYDDNIRELANNIKKSKFGKIQKVVCHYGKGLRNNGSHMLDLLNYFFGFPHAVRALDIIKDDRISGPDPTLSAQLIYKKPTSFDVFLTAQNHQYFTNFEMDLFFSKQRIVIKDGGRLIEYFKIVEDKDYTNYFILQKEFSTQNGLKNTFLNAGAEIYDLWRKETLKTTSHINNSIDVYKVIDAIHKSWAYKCREITL